MEKLIVLTVDDTPSVRLFVGKLLAKIGFEVVEAGDGVEGLARLASLKAGNTPPRLILSDLNMPNMDGLSFIREVRKRDQKTPILMLTTIGTEEKRKEGKEAGANGWLTKPLSPVSFQETVKKITGVGLP